MKNKLQGILLLICFSLAATESYSQFSSKTKDGIKYYIDDKDSSKFVKFNMCGQIWMRNTAANPGTTVAGTAQSNITDISIRRIRFVVSGQLTDRISFFVQFGQNNLNYLSSRKAGSFFHDITADYAVIKKKLSLGFGLNGWNGPSRFSNTSIASIPVLDPPNYQEVTNDTYDQFVRRLGVYAKGKLGKLDYRISAAKPFIIQTASGIDPINSTAATFSTLPPKFVYQGYFMYQFLDQESNFGPGVAGNYLGSKKVFNIGAGFYTQKNAMFQLVNAGADTSKQDIMLLSADVFYDTPLNKDKGTAFNVYASYSHYNYGNQFIKVSGPDNPANGSNITTNSFTKANYGNAFPYLGTGNVYYIQTAYKMKKDLLGEHGTLQPYANLQLANYSRLSSLMYVYDVGVNWLIKGQSSKFTLDYQNRPFFSQNGAGEFKQGSRRGQLVLQYQISI